MRFAAVVAFTIISGLNLFSQQLFINELSQGPSGSLEYVELVVAGDASCQSPTPCLDMRGIVIDDNNGHFASGSGTGIAPGAMRFASTSFWQCIPIGTLIVIYNESERNASIPADDLSMSDGNNLLILPASSNLLEKHTSIPSNSNNTYSSSGWASGGQWSTVGMRNGGDAFQIRQNISSTTPSHAVSYGDNNQNQIIYFSGNAGGKVFSMMNTTNDNSSIQSNWQSASAMTNQTPGAPNSPQNQAWINSMLNNSGGSGLNLTVSSTNTGCGTACTGTASVTVSGGTAPYTYDWSNNATTASVSNLCAQTYTVEVTDANGCNATEQVIISQESNTVSVAANATNENCPGSCDGTVTTTVTGGISPYTYTWSNGATTSSLSGLCPQVYTVQVTDASGCTATTQATVGTNTTTLAISTSGTNESCANECDGTVTATVSGGTSPYTYSWSNGGTTPTIQNLCDGSYTVTVTDANGCQSTANQPVLPGAAGQTPVITPAGPYTTNDTPSQLTVSVPGGTWTADCTNCISSNGVFDPQTAGPGNHQVCYTIGSGACAETACITITVTQGCETQYTSEDINACLGESIVFEGQEITLDGSYDFSYLDVNGCDSIHTVHFSIFNATPLNDFITTCEGDSVEVNGTWYYESIIVHYETTDVNGCILENTATITMNDCTIDPFNVFIPNTFTPNGDMVNDLFFITISEGMLENGFILNRWGEVVKEFSAEDLSWDGHTKSGQMAPDGVYTYVVVIQQKGGVKEQFHGFVTLIR